MTFWVQRTAERLRRQRSTKSHTSIVTDVVPSDGVKSRLLDPKSCFEHLAIHNIIGKETRAIQVEWLRSIKILGMTVTPGTWLLVDEQSDQAGNQKRHVAVVKHLLCANHSGDSKCVNEDELYFISTDAYSLQENEYSLGSCAGVFHVPSQLLLGNLRPAVFVCGFVALKSLMCSQTCHNGTHTFLLGV